MIGARGKPPAESDGTEHGKLLQWLVFSVNLLLSQITREVLTQGFPDAS